MSHWKPIDSHQYLSFCSNPNSTRLNFLAALPNLCPSSAHLPNPNLCPPRSQIRDLLRPESNPPDGLGLKDHPELGPTLYRDREIWPPLPIDSVEHMFAMLDEVCARFAALRAVFCEVFQIKCL